MVPLRFLLRWSWRDLRRRWLQVAATALVIAMGTGLYAGLGGMEDWRIKSNDASFSQLNFHDLRATLSAGSYVPEGRLAGAVRAGSTARLVSDAQERLIAPTQIDASRPGRVVLLPGEIVGVPVTGPGASIDGIDAVRGRSLGASDANRNVAVVDRNFAKFYGLPDSGRLRLAGLGSVPYVGQGASPQHFLTTTPGGFGGQATLGFVYMPLRAAQRAAHRPGKVNELALKLAPGVDVRRAEVGIQRVLRARLPRVGVTFTRGTAEDSYRILYRDARNDQRFFNVFALLLLAGASFAAFNLVSRVVEAERREIGIGMALGVEPRTLALRPLLLAGEIAVLGVAFGLAVGAIAADLIGGVFRDQLPLPSYAGTFQPRVFVVGAAIGFLLPFAAAAWPVWRAVRVQPMEAIRVSFRSAKGGGLAPLLKRIKLPGRSLTQLPIRNVARAPRRTLLTLLGLAGVVTTVVALAGMIDSFNKTIDMAESEMLTSSPSRLTVRLDRFYPRGPGPISSIRGSRAVGAVEPGLNVPGTLRAGGRKLDASVSFIDPASRIWRPRVRRGSFARGSHGIVITEKAAHDLRVGLGDYVVARLPARRGASAFELVDRPLRVVALYPNPFRFFAYLDRGQAGALGLGGLVNTATVTPAPGFSQDAVQRSLFGLPGVASTQSVFADTDALQDAMDQFIDVIRVTEIAALLLAVLMAFNSTAIAVDERRRELATMFAYGVPVRTGLRVAMVESMITGALGTLVGIALGLVIVGWVVNSLTPDVWPQIGMIVTLSAGSAGAAVLVGLGAVTIAPLLTVRRMRHLDIPSTLRVVE
jgi:putative ABC transport system permease protein